MLWGCIQLSSCVGDIVCWVIGPCFDVPVLALGSKLSVDLLPVLGEHPDVVIQYPP